MSIELLNEPKRRRWWLLQKGLETTSFRDALLLAQAAEDFLLGKPTGKVAVFSADDAAVALAPPQASAHPAIQIAVQVGAAAAGNNQPEMQNAIEANSGPDDRAVDDAAPTGPVSLPAPDEVVRFLRQNDDVVVSAGPGTYLVNGRFRESTQELIARANRVRARRNQPPFAPVPVLACLTDKLYDSAVPCNSL
jgi:hypothetical protein